MSLEINLLHQHKTSKIAQRAVFLLRLFTIISGAIVLLSLSAIFILKKNLELSLDTKTNYHNELMARVVKNQEKETSALLLNEKYKAIDAIMKAEPPFLTYYETLMRELPNSSESGKLSSVNMQKNGTAVVHVLFPNIIAMTKFLSHVETDAFKKQFTAVRTSNITFSKDGSKEVQFSLDVTF